jgi:anaerobic selenocysteine-containing dehydrogenase
MPPRGPAPACGSGAAAALCALATLACNGAGDSLSVTPKTMRDVPSDRLAFRFEADVAEENLPEQARDAGAPAEKLESIARDFETRRPDEELLRTVVSPDGQRALALYATSENRRL